VALPGLPVSGTQQDEGTARGCVLLWNEALPGTGLAERVKALKPGEKRCMVAWMLHTCVRALEQYDDTMREQGVALLLTRRKREQLRQVAEDFTREECKAVPRTQAQLRLLESLRAALYKSLNLEEEP
jgi:hypothetical protein